MPRLLRVALPALTVAGLTQLVQAARFALHESAAHGWSAQGLGWLALERFGETPLETATLVALGVALGIAAAIELLGAEKGALRRVARVLGHPLVVVLALVAGFLFPRLYAGASRPTPPKGAPNLLFVLVDTWRADHAGFLGYARDTTPTLDGLVSSGVVFEHAISQASWTKPAVATLFTGETPSRHGAVSNPVEGEAVRGLSLARSKTTFLEILRGHGWDTGAWSSNPNIVRQRGFAQGTGVFYDAFDDPRKSATFDPGRSEYLVAEAHAWIQGEGRDPSRPFAAYVHVMDPHYPYEAPPPYGGHFDSADVDFPLDGKVCDSFYDGERDVSKVTPAMVQSVIDRYDDEILYMDHNVGGLITEVLREHPDTVVVLVGDHGEEFLEHGQFGHGIGLWQTLVHVPLVVWAPDLRSERVATQVRLMDVMPTLLELVGLSRSIPSAVQGSSLLPVIAGQETADRVAPLESGGDGRPAWQWRGVTDGRWKALRREPDRPGHATKPLYSFERGATYPLTRAYDLDADPGEQHDLAGSDPAAAAEAETLLANARKAGWILTPDELFSGLRAQRVEMGGDIEALQKLGYAGKSDLEARDGAKKKPANGGQ